ncbi:Imm26 family immunity protein, partial [Anaerosolibacter sp.]|uniref:Imm26 family immunity protein n=1 Tax=Anaerosolibacter sp. TaxID=1872527 RepID=UPI0039EEBA37
YGRVIRTDIKNFGNLEWNLIYIYDEIKRGIDESYVLDPNKLLIPPQIVNNQGWIKGYFYTVGNKPLTTSDYARNYGFWDTLRAIYVDEDGVPMDVKPSMYTDYGLGSYGIVGLDVQKALEKKNII